jgi:hypothetical protein
VKKGEGGKVGKEKIELIDEIEIIEGIDIIEGRKRILGMM